jgi:hypothetical protein
MDKKAGLFSETRSTLRCEGQACYPRPGSHPVLPKQDESCQRTKMRTLFENRFEQDLKSASEALTITG